MKETFLRIKDKILGTTQEEDIPDEFGEDYLEIDSEQQPAKKSKVLVKPFMIREFQDVKLVLDALRDGYTIALVNIKPIKDKDIIGFGEDWLVATPNFASVDRSPARAVAPAQENAREF